MNRFEDLRTFVRVGELGSVTRAAEELERAPSAVSRRLKELEARLGVQLLTRTTRQLALTDAGERLLRRAQRILADLDEAEQDATESAGTLRGQLRLSAPLSFGIAHLTPAINRFLAAHPALQMDLDLNDQHVDLLVRRLDLAVRIGDLSDSTLRTRKLASIRHVVAASPDWWQRHGRPQSPTDLQGHSALCYTHLLRPGDWHWRSANGNTGSVAMAPRLVSSNGDALVQASVAGLGVVRQPSFLVAGAIESGQLEPALLDYNWGSVPLQVVWPDARFVPGKTRAFIDHLVQCFTGPPQWKQCLDRARRPD